MDNSLDIIHGISDVDGSIEEINTFRNATKMYDGLVHKIGVNEHFCRGTGTSTTLSVAATSGDTSITVADATGIIVGSLVQLHNGGTRELIHFHVNGVAGNVLTLSAPLDNSHDIGDTVEEVTVNMNVNGSLGSPISFKVQPPTGERWQFTRILPTMLDSAPATMDDGKFGALTALTNGVVVRTYVDGVFRTLTHWHKNNDLKEDMYDLTYSPNAPAGQSGLSARWTFTKAEFAPDLVGSNGDYIEVLIQDDLTGLDEFKIKIQGRLFGG